MLISKKQGQVFWSMLDPAEEPKSLTRSQTNRRLAVGSIENEWSRTSGLSSSDDVEILPR